MTGRFYTVDGLQLPSVTTIISHTLHNPAITAWRLRVGDAEAHRISLDATTWGTDQHAAIELVNRGKRATLTDEQWALVAPYAAWKDVNVQTVIATEKLVISRAHGFAGTADLVAVLDGDDTPTMLDFKTSKTPLALPEWRLQLAAYCLAAEEHLGLICRRRVIVRLSRQEPDTLHVHELPADTLDDDKAVFLSLLHVFRWRQASGEIAIPNPKSLGKITFRRNGR